MEHPYSQPEDPHFATPVGGQAPVWARFVLSLIGFLLYCSTPWRDARFYRDILDNEGFATTADSIPVAIAGSVIATIVFSPIALLVIGYGIGSTNRITLYPRMAGLWHLWGIFATTVLTLMLLIESDYIIAAFRHRHHWLTGIWSVACVAFMYVWWCCSLTHRTAE